MFLTGMMGAGKSTLAPRLAARWRAEWVDLDVRVERVFGVSIPQLFGRGESAFRRLEKCALRSLLREPGVRGRTLVVATGGGLVIDPENRGEMAKAGVVVYLRVPAATLAERLVRSRALGNRPLLGDTLTGVKDRMNDLLTRRSALYATAAFTVDADGTSDECLARLLSTLQNRHP